MFNFSKQDSTATPKPSVGTTSSFTNPTSSAPSTGLFGTGTTAASSGSIFGAGALIVPPTNTSNSLFGEAQSSANIGSVAKTSGDAPKPSLFGSAVRSTIGDAAASSPVSFSFGTAAGSTPTATPAANKTSFLSSTTPAGAPPGTSIFGQNEKVGGTTQAGFSLFSGGKPTTATSVATPGFSGNAPSGSLAVAPSTSSAPGSGLFSMNKTADSSSSAPAAAKPGLFGSFGSTTPSSTPAKPLTFGADTTTQPSSSQAAITTAPAFSIGGSTLSNSSTAPTSNLFSGAVAATGPSATGGSLFSMGNSTTFSNSNAPALVGAATTTNSGATSTTKTSGSSLFPALGSATGSSQLPNLGGGSSAPPTSGTTTTSAAKSSLFSQATASEAQPSLPTTTSQPTPPIGTTTAASATDANKTGLASSTIGPIPSAQSRLKNKSMDEIITRWAADLSKYQKEFQQQAEIVAQWDRALVENSDKVRQLYSKTFQAERDAAEVERQLTMMEENQQELDSYLDRYEKEIENLMKMHGVSGKSDGLRGPDQERERTYRLAEKLQERLNELNKDLTEMIEEINNISQTLSRTGKPDDPLTKVVRVLNTQLAQLQLIDSGASQLRDKIAMAQNESQYVGNHGWNGIGADAADDFYRNYRGGRTERFGGVS